MSNSSSIIRNPLKLSLRIKKVPIELENEDGSLWNGELREMTAPLKEQYQNEMQKAIEFDDDGNGKRIKDHVGLQNILITRCLYDNAGKPVSGNVVNSWPTSVVEAIHDECQTINGLNKKGIEEAKKV